MDNSPNDFVLAKDFHSHQIDASGFCPWGWVCENSVCIGTSDSTTFFRGSAMSPLELALSSAGLRLLTWVILTGGTNSDDFSIMLELQIQPCKLTRHSHTFFSTSKLKQTLIRWVSRYARWIFVFSLNNIISLLTKYVHKASPVINPVKDFSPAPRWKADCAQDCRRRKAAGEKLLHKTCPTISNNLQFLRTCVKHTDACSKPVYYTNKTRTPI